MIRVFIGYDPAEAAAYNVLAHSINVNASTPVAITPIMQSQLKDVYNRPHHNLASTQFSFSRFLTPYLCDYEGWALFIDCDMLFKADIKELWDLRDERYAVQVVKHDHQPQSSTKFLDNIQTRYEKKNWSSVILFNCAKCQALTPDYVNSASGLELHQFKWLESDEQIGEIPKAWNHLVDYDDYDENVKNIHYTEGGPYFEEYLDCGYASDWLEAREQMLFALNKKALSFKETG